MKNKSQSQILDAYAKKDAFILSYLENLLSDIIDDYKKREIQSGNIFDGAGRKENMDFLVDGNRRYA